MPTTDEYMSDILGEISDCERYIKFFDQFTNLRSDDEIVRYFIKRINQLRRNMVISVGDEVALVCPNDFFDNEKYYTLPGIVRDVDNHGLFDVTFGPEDNQSIVFCKRENIFRIK